ncbi:hypothetical protein DRO56_05405 [Candidatus Bathyarchaeota archaeon]|nr:MAG: hypothetical protein DRO56_05405 [Candidatus Bathyarchaeota archaeon]
MIKSPIKLLSAWSTFFTYPNLGDSRLRTLLYFSLFMFTGLFSTSRGIPPLIIILKAFGTTVSIIVFVYALGDAMDADMDKFNPRKSQRPVPSGRMTRDEALLLSALGGVLSIAISLTINLWAMTIILASMGLGFSYSVPPIRLKRRFLMKETTLTTGLILSMLFGSTAVGKIPGSIFLPGLFLTIVGLILYPSFLDAEDIQADSMGGCKTLAMILNQRRRLELSTFGLLVIMVTTTLTYGYFGLNMICPILTVFASLMFLRYLFPLLIAPEEECKGEILKRGISIFRTFVFLVPLGFILGSLQL